MSGQPSRFLGQRIPPMSGEGKPGALTILIFSDPRVPELNEVWILPSPNPHSLRKRNQESWRVASLSPLTPSPVLKSSDHKLALGQSAH